MNKTDKIPLLSKNDSLINLDDKEYSSQFRVAGNSAITSAPQINYEYLIDDVTTKPKHESGIKIGKGIFSAISVCALPVISWIYLPAKTHLIKKGYVGLSWNNGVPELLTPGWHLLLSPVRNWVQEVPLSQLSIKHGTWTIVTIQEGYLGLATDRGKPMLLPPGMHQWNSDTMTFIEAFDLSQAVVKIPPYTYVTVDEGTVAITHNNGILEILPPGYHLLTHERHIFHGSLFTTDQFNELNELDLITKDNVPVSVDCTVHFKIRDTRTAGLEAGHMENVRELVMREARAAMASSVLQSTVSDLELLGANDEDEITLIPGRASQNYEGRDNTEKRGAYLTSAKKTLKKIGVDLFKIPIRRIRILDKEINQRLAQQASIRVKRMEDLDTAEVHKQTIEIEAEARANEDIIKAKAESKKIQILADAELYKAKKMHEAGCLLSQNSIATRLAELDSMQHIVSATQTNTIFSNSDGIVSSLLGNPNFVKTPNAQKEVKKQRVRDSETSEHNDNSFLE